MSPARLRVHTWCDPSLARVEEHQLSSDVLRVLSQRPQKHVHAGQFPRTESCPGAKRGWRWAWPTIKVRVSIGTGVPRQDCSLPLIHLEHGNSYQLILSGCFLQKSPDCVNQITWLSINHSHHPLVFWKLMKRLVLGSVLCMQMMNYRWKQGEGCLWLAWRGVDERKLSAAPDYLLWHCWEKFKPQRLWFSWDIVSLLQELLKCTEL